MADLVSATSLLATVVALFHTLWYGEIRDALTFTPERKRADRDGQVQQVDAAFRRRGVPLAVGGTLLCVVLAPEAIRVVGAMIRAVISGPPASWPPYDTLAAAFVVAYLFLAAMASLSVSQTIDLAKRLRDLRRPD